MWTIINPLLRPQFRAAVSGLGGDGPQRLTHTDLQAVSRTVTQYYQGQQEQGPREAPSRMEAARSLDRLANSGSVSPEEQQRIQALQARITSGQPLTEQDVQGVTGVVDTLERSMNITGSRQSPLYGDIAPNPYVGPSPETQAARDHNEQGRAAIQGNPHNYPQAEQEFRQGLAALPPGNGELQGRLQQNLGASLNLQNRFGEAVQEYQRVLETPGASDASRRRAEERLRELRPEALSGIGPNPYRPN